MKLIHFVLFLLTLVSTLFGQPMSRFDERVHKMELLTPLVQFTAGQVQRQETTTTPTTPAKLFVWSDKKYYLPGEVIKIRVFALADDAENLQANVTEIYNSGYGDFGLTSAVCECGDSNGGSIPSLRSFNFITVLTKVMPSKIGRYDFTVNFNKYPGNGLPGVPYQSTTLTVYAHFSERPENNPIQIDRLEQGLGAGPILFLTGRFPQGVPIHFFSGTAPYSGSWATAVSQDGTHLVLPEARMHRSEARVILMTQDGSFSTTSQQTYIPALTR